MVCNDIFHLLRKFVLEVGPVACENHDNVLKTLLFSILIIFSFFNILNTTSEFNNQ